MSNPFCQRCGCIAEDDLELCIQCRESGLKAEGKDEQMDCAFPCNGVCRDCGQPVVYVLMLPLDENSKPVAMNPELEHGGNVEIRPNKSGRLFAKDTGPDPEERKFIVHSIACVGRRPRSKSDATMPMPESKSDPNRQKTWPEERSEMIQQALKGLQ